MHFLYMQWTKRGISRNYLDNYRRWIGKFNDNWIIGSNIDLECQMKVDLTIYSVYEIIFRCGIKIMSANYTERILIEY